MATHYEDMFIDYFSDLVEVVNQLIISSKVLKKIGAHLVIKYLAEFLEVNGVTLFQTSQNLSRSIVENSNWSQLGRLYHSKGAYEEAIDSYKKVLDIFPNDPEVLYHLKLAYDAISKNDLALSIHSYEFCDYKSRP